MELLVTVVAYVLFVSFAISVFLGGRRLFQLYLIHWAIFLIWSVSLVIVPGDAAGFVDVNIALFAAVLVVGGIVSWICWGIVFLAGWLPEQSRD